MEVFFLLVLVLLMVMALTAGFPVAFSLQGSAILSIGLAALAGYYLKGMLLHILLSTVRLSG